MEVLFFLVLILNIWNRS